jgi:hypothetical protein
MIIIKKISLSVEENPTNEFVGQTIIYDSLEEFSKGFFFFIDIKWC